MKTSAEMKELLTLAEAHRAEKNERLRLAKLKEEHRRVMQEIGGEDISDPKVQKKAADATLGLALVDARLARLAVPTRDFERMDGLLRIEVKRYNQAVVAARDAALEQLIRSQLPFFRDEHDCRRYWRNAVHEHPMFHAFRKAIEDVPTSRREERDVIQEVESFISHAERHSKTLGLS